MADLAPHPLELHLPRIVIAVKPVMTREMTTQQQEIYDILLESLKRLEGKAFSAELAGGAFGFLQVR